MQRDRLICCLVGKYTALDPSVTANDLRIQIDQHLAECHLTPIGSEEGDTELLQDLLDETMISVLGQGVNRKMRRTVWSSTKKEIGRT